MNGEKGFTSEVMPDTFEGSVVIDNGEVKGIFNLGDAHWKLKHLVGKDAANRLCWEVVKFKDQVNKDKREGIALGSTDLEAALDSLYYDRDGEDGMKDPRVFGLETTRELKLAAHVVSTFIKSTESEKT